MPDARFFPPAGPFSVSRLAEIAGASPAAAADPGRRISDIAPLDCARADEIGFLGNKSYVAQFRETKAGCCLVEEKYADQAPAGTDVLLTDHPYLAWAKVATAFHPGSEDSYVPLNAAENIHSDAAIGEGTKIGSGTVIGPGARLGKRCVIAPNVYIGDAVEIGDDCRIGPSASVRFALIGNGVTLYAGARIGEAGFGFALSPRGAITIPQVGRVLIEDDVEVGANTTIDRGAVRDTVIGAGTRIDNLVQIGHNVRIGRNCVIVSMAGVAGSATLGNRVMIGGQAAIAGHLSIGDDARVAGKSGVMRNVAPGATVMGLPAVPIKQFFRQTVKLSRLSQKGTRNENDQ